MLGAERHPEDYIDPISGFDYSAPLMDGPSMHRYRLEHLRASHRRARNTMHGSTFSALVCLAYSVALALAGSLLLTGCCLIATTAFVVDALIARRDAASAHSDIIELELEASLGVTPPRRPVTHRVAR